MKRAQVVSNEGVNRRRHASPPRRDDDREGHYVFNLGENLTPRCQFSFSCSFLHSLNLLAAIVFLLLLLPLYFIIYLMQPKFQLNAFALHAIGLNLRLPICLNKSRRLLAL